MEPVRVFLRVADLPNEERRRRLRDALRILLASRIADGSDDAMIMRQRRSPLRELRPASATAIRLYPE